MRAWYIDGIDALGGIAFASLRDTDESEATYVEADATVFLEPPYFVAEPILSRSTALAATRGSLQAGFFVNKAEYPFQSVAEVSDFVRRLYVGGAGGGATGGAGPPPAPDQPTGEDDPVTEPREGVSDVLRDCFARFARDVKKATVGAARPMKWDLGISASEDLDWHLSSLRLAGLRLIRTLWLRKPNGKNDDPEWWGKAWGAVLALLLKVGIWPYVEDALRRNPQDAELHQAIRWWDPPWRDLWNNPRGDLWNNPRFDDDPYEALRYIPLPANLTRELEGVAAGVDASSVANLLALILSSPQTIESLGAANPRVAAEIGLLAAAAIVSVDIMEGAPLTLVEYWTPLGSRILGSALPKLTSAALTWCNRSLPHFAFARQVEDQIAGIAARPRV